MLSGGKGDEEVKREILALATLLSLLLTSLWSIGRADKLIKDVTDNTALALELSLKSEPEKAADAMDRAIAIWDDARGYSHIFIRHSELDRCTDSLYQVKAMLAASEPEELEAGFQLLHAQLASIAAMERINSGNIF